MKFATLLLAILVLSGLSSSAWAEDDDLFAFLSDGSLERGEAPDFDKTIGILIKVKIVKVVKQKPASGAEDKTLPDASEQTPLSTSASRAPATKAEPQPTKESGVTLVDFGQKPEKTKAVSPPLNPQPAPVLLPRL